MDLSGTSPRKSLVDRAKAIILTPKDEWPVIAAEQTSIGDILKGYVLPLAAIGPVAGFIGGQIFGYGAFGVSFKPSFMSGISTLVVGYALAVAMVFALMLIADFLAPKFGGVSNRLNAFKLVAYGYTAGWLAGIFGLVPALGVFALLGLYSIYLLYTGVTPLMQVPKDKAVGYLAVTILCAIVLSILLAPVTALITGIWGAGSAASYDAGSVSGKIEVPGGGTVDLGQIEKMGKQMENSANGTMPAVDSAKIAALLPTSIGSYARTATQSAAVGAMGSSSEATYTAGDKSFNLRVIDMGGLGALAGIGGAMGVQSSREDASGYERTTTVNGQMQSESWNTGSNSGKFGRMVSSRFMVEAEGSAANIDELKAAVATIDPADLTELAE